MTPRKQTALAITIAFLVGVYIFWNDYYLKPEMAQKDREITARSALLFLVANQMSYEMNNGGKFAPDCVTLAASNLATTPSTNGHDLVSAFQKNENNGDSAQPRACKGYIYMMLPGPQNHFGITARPVDQKAGRFQYLILDDLKAWWKIDSPGTFTLTKYPSVDYNYAADGWNSEDGRTR
jgi:hypothetical protein